MFFASTRSKFKLRPPKLLVYYSLCLSILFMILLCTIVQLRAVELAPRQKSSRSIATSTSSSSSSPTSDTHPLPDFPEIQLILNQTDNIYDDSAQFQSEVRSGASTRAPDSIDRDDRANTYDELSESSASPNGTYAGEFPASIAQDLVVAPSETANHHLSVATESQQVSPRPDEPDRQRPSLAELTAAGTAAGLLVHDMMAQANMVNQLPYNGGDLGDGNAQQVAGDGDDAPPSPHLVQQMLQMQAGQQHAVHGDAGAWQRPSGGMQTLQTRQVDSAAEPPSEDQMPDSIESLMGADGAAADEDDEPLGSGDRPQQSAGVDESGEGETPTGLLSQQAINQQQLVAAAAIASENGDDDDDGGDADENDDGRDARQARVALQQAGSNAYGHNGAVPVLMSSPRYDSPERLMALGRLAGEQEQSLVAPMRDSLVDLNAAAGHYYGKKKKKKTIIIKKKKKKKKMKYKKIKIIKIKKKKKKVKKKKPKKHHHAKHHDHGKYYMYAKVPKKKSWEFGFKKGNKKHWIERHEKGHKNKFKTKVKWYDKKSKGKGVHIWDYNHHDKKKKKHY